jgi:hypothetical protein
MAGGSGRWVRIEDIAKTALPLEWKIALVKVCTQELEIIQEMEAVHGAADGWARYIAAGGNIRPGDHGQPVIWCPA